MADNGKDLSPLESEMLALMLGRGGYGSSGDLEHRLRERAPRPALRTAWLSLISRGLVLKNTQTTRSTPDKPSYWLKVADVATARARLDRELYAAPLSLGDRSRLSALAERATLAAA